MSRRKAKPRKSVRTLSKQFIVSGEDSEDVVGASGHMCQKEDEKTFASAGTYYFIDVDRSSWDANEHFDISEIVLSNLDVKELKEDVNLECIYGLRFRLGNGNNKIADRINPGHWPVFSVANVHLEFVQETVVDGVEIYDAVLSGNFNGPDESVSGLVHLASLKFLTLRPLMGARVSANIKSIRLRVELLQRAFNAADSLLDIGRQFWKKSMMNVMEWLRPEFTTSEAHYGVSLSNNVDAHMEVDKDVQKYSSFDAARFYEAIQPSKDMPMLEDELPDLFPALRPYQRRAAHWMVQREMEIMYDETGRFHSPFSAAVTFLDSSSKMFYNPFSGNISLSPVHHQSCVFGGILADEMGMGKTVELLACVFANRMLSSVGGTHSDNGIDSTLNQKLRIRRVKRERVECICGAVSESSRYEGMWVQCDACDAWQHAECVGFSSTRSKRSLKKASRKQSHNGKARKITNTDTYSIEGEYVCPLCTELIQATSSPVPSAATLIICPSPILQQWHAEIIRHTKPGSLRTFVYEGVRDTSLRSSGDNLSELVDADIVLTTYDNLKEDLSHDFDRHEGDRRLMRYEKRYPVTPTLLTRIFWWRICLDEAQMVENNAAAATEMAMRLHARNRWCITGTPIQRKLDDLYALLRFLKVSPFDTPRWWVEVIRNPFERKDVGAMEFTHSLFRHLMWRSSKLLVADELQLPPQEECLSWLSFSPVEEHFYQRQHETCTDHAFDVLKRFKAGAVSCDLQSDSFVTHADAAKLLNSLLKLRQACCHPQVGSSGIRSLEQSPMTMDEILSVLVSKTKIEGEEALRKLVSSLNGLAGVAMIRGERSQALLLYKEALTISEEHSEDFRLDPLLSLHIHHNLAELLSSSSNSFGVHPSGGHMTRIPVDRDIFQHNSKRRKVLEDGDFVADIESAEPCGQECGSGSETPWSFAVSKSVEVCENVKQKYLSAFYSKLSMVQEEFQNSFKQVNEAYNEKSYQHTTWWLEPLHQIETNNDVFRDFIRKIEDVVSGSRNSAKTSRTFRSIRSLTYYIQTGLDSLEAGRKKLLHRLLEIDLTMRNPREADVERVRHCPNCYADQDGPLCVHCELDELFQAYEAGLFLSKRDHNGGTVTSAEEAVDLQKKKLELNHFYWGLAEKGKAAAASSSQGDQGTKRKRDNGKILVVSRSPSEVEITLGILRNYFKVQLGRQGLSAASKHMSLLEGMRKEYAHARSLAIAQAQVLRAHDEIMMASSRLRLRENNKDTALDTLSLEELDIADLQNSTEKYVSQALLERTKGKLRYLQGLVLSNQKKDLVEGCAVHLNSHLEEHKSESEVDEEICPVCQEKLQNQKMVFQCGFFTITERRAVLYPRQQHTRVMCPTCRQPSDFSNIALADDRPTSSPHTMSRSAEESVTISGSYGTKIEAITRRILWIKSADPTTKVLVFSSWNDVLDLLEHAFEANQIRYVRMKGGRKSQAAISIFKGEDICPKKVGKSNNHEQELAPVQVLLLLIQHGANGLNLLEAQHVILVEPLLNPAAEAQAISRVHRIGQKIKTVVHRFLVKGTVEESIYNLNKSRDTNSFISGNKKNQDQPLLTLKDVESLFTPAQSAVPQTNEASESLMHLPPSVAAAIAADRRLNESRPPC
ncbi:E3 ubiquitin-protein ligase SHPRH-like protein [Drosera capensis]